MHSNSLRLVDFTMMFDNRLVIFQLNNFKMIMAVECSNFEYLNFNKACKLDQPNEWSIKSRCWAHCIIESGFHENLNLGLVYQ